jgi:hypothetical protein
MRRLFMGHMPGLCTRKKEEASAPVRRRRGGPLGSGVTCSREGPGLALARTVA